MNTLYILELGYTRSDLASIAKVFGLTATIIGGLLGGLILFKISLRRALIIFGLLQAVSTLGFIALNHFPIGYLPLAMVIAFENISSGLGTTAFIAYMAIQTNKKFSATQYAILSSLTGVPRVILGAYTGYIATYLGWDNFYLFCAVVAIPGLLLLYWKKV